MRESDAIFTGSIPELYDRHMAPIFMEPYANYLAARFSDTTHGTLLELAAGTGVFSRALDRALPPSVSLVATDLSQSMLDYASARSNGRIIWRHADAQNLPFPDSSFDGVLCQLGVMFFPDKVAAYRQARRVLRPDARFQFLVWDRLEVNELSLAISEAIGAALPDGRAQFLARVPFAYFDPTQIQSDLRAAGFSSVEIETIILPSCAPSPLDVATAICQGTPLRNELESHSPTLCHELTRAVAAHLASRFGPGPIRTQMQALLVSAPA